MPAASRRSWLEPLARAGFVAKGVVYLLLGALTGRVALGLGGRLTDGSGAVKLLLRGPFGVPLVALLAAGLALYAGWRLLEAFADANRKGTRPKGVATRAAYAVSGLVYGALALDAARLALHEPSGGDGRWLLLAAVRAAPWLVSVGGAALAAYGAHQALQALRGRVSSRLDTGSTEREMGPWALAVSRFGLAARGLVFMALGVLLIPTPAGEDAVEADVSDGLRALGRLPYGRWLLLAAALGLAAYGVYQLVHARYRRIVPP